MSEQTYNTRINSIDFMRGLVIVIMAIDHIRDLLYTSTHDPLDLATTTPALFMTRWITHLCAPTFVFLAGVSAFLTLKSQNNFLKTKSFLLKRGIFLIILELTVVGFGVWFDIYFRTILLQVIFAIGAGFFILSFLLRIPDRVIGAIGLFIILFHNLLPAVKSENNVLEFIRTILTDRGFFKLSEDRGLMVAYPVIPWLGILMFGFGFGKIFTMPDQLRRRNLLIAGSVALLIFISLRLLNGYGDSKHWSFQASSLHTFFSFIDVTKYPPSLLYTAVTLAITFFVLCLADNKNNLFIRTLITYGRVPLFFYIIHWYVIHISMVIMIMIQGFEWKDMTFGLMQFGRPPSSVGLELPYIYVYWLSLIICLYPLCVWYGKYKASHRQITWLKYV